MLDEWVAVWVKVPADVQAEITALHEKNMHECCGYSEGQHCCIDFLDGGADQGYQDIIRRLGKGKP